jgi:putative ABC transport system ATP-binding protein
MPIQTALRLDNIHKAFGQGDDRRVVLDGLSLELEEGEFVTVLGSNGAGTSTLVNIISGLTRPDAGRVLIGGSDVTTMVDFKRARFIGHLFQDARKGTAPELTIEENLALVNAKTTRRFPLARALRASDRALFREKLARFGMGLENRLKTRVGSLSGGQRQALALLLATLVPPKILLLDEHTAALDPMSARKILALTREITAETRVATLMITHNVPSSLEIGNRTVMLRRGKIVMDIRGEDRARISAGELLERYNEAEAGDASGASEGAGTLNLP